MIEVAEKLVGSLTSSLLKGLSSRDLAYLSWRILREFKEGIIVVLGVARRDAVVLESFGTQAEFRNLTIPYSKKCLSCCVVEKGKEVYLPNVWDFNEDGYSVIIPRREEEPYTFFGVPLMVEDRVVGMMGFALAGEDAFNEEERRLFRMIAKIVAIPMGLEKGEGKYDRLTGALSRDYFYNEFLSSGNMGFSSLMIIDIKGLHKINEALGYVKGDEVLRTLSDILRGHMGKDDVLVRLGEDEFLALFQEDPDFSKVVDEISILLERRTGIPVDFQYGYSKVSGGIEAAIIDALSNMKLKRFQLDVAEEPGYMEITDSDIERFEKSEKGIVIHNIDEVFYINDKIVQLLGLKSREDMRKYHALSFTAPEYREMAYRRAKLVLDTGIKLPPAIEKGFTVRGEPITVVVNTYPVIYKGKKAVMITIEDITIYTFREAISKFMDIFSRILENLVALETEMYDVIFETIQQIFPDLNLILFRVDGERAKLIYGKFREEEFKGEDFILDDLPLVKRYTTSGKESYIPDASDLTTRCKCPFGLAGQVASHYGFPIKIDGSVRMIVVAVKGGYDTIKPYEMDLVRTVGRHLERKLRVEMILKELESEKKKYMELAFKDQLTGAYTRAFFMEWLKTYQEKQKRLLESSSLVIMDINCLKEINDKYGHDVGDEVLRSFAKAVMSSVRSMDIFVRWGGDEFLLVLPNTPPEAAKGIVRRISETTPIKFSYGIHEFGHKMDFQEAFRIADERLYSMKKDRRCTPDELDETVLRITE